MRFKKGARIEAGLKQIDIVPLIDCIFLLLIFFMLTSSFVVIPGINIKLPRAITSEEVDSRSLTIVITSEDIIYVDDKPQTIAEIGVRLKESKVNSIFIKADRDASLGMVVNLWDICKKHEIEKIGIATTYDD
ncbi:MAG: biopolymer transporter ExbD [Candidatus Omnitrophica bacterium]|nr:biopolymer transporter ExbD [Candidatus Omnitrophota bacterium]